MAVEIRTFAAADVPAAGAITNAHILGTHIHFASHPLTDEAFLAQWQESQPRYPWLAATLGSRLAGYARSSPWRTRDAYRFTVETTVYIHPDFHRRGFGRRLMQALLEDLAGRGFHNAIAGIALPNPGSVALHENLGFRAVGIFERVGFKFDRWWDVGFWQIELQPTTD